MTSQHYVKVTDAHAIVVGIWDIAETEWRRTPLRLLVKRGRRTYVDLAVAIPDEILPAVEA